MEIGKKITLLILFILVAAAVIGIGAWYSSRPAGTGATVDQTTQTSSMAQLQITDLTVGTGAEAQLGNTVTVNYIGTLDDGTKFDSSYDRNQPFSFLLGAGDVISGWDQGVLGMKVGGKRELVIPPDLAYGAAGRPGIPPNATLHFTIELLSVSSGTPTGAGQ